MKLFVHFMCVLGFALPAFAEENNSVQLTGTVFDSPASHTTNHFHSLQFEDAQSKKNFDVVDSPQIEKLHHETNKNYQVALEGRITPKFLFWGGNLVISKFEITGESDAIPLGVPARTLRERNIGRNGI